MQEISDGALALIEVVHELMELPADGVKLHEYVASALEDLRQAGLIGAWDFRSRCNRVTLDCSRSDVDEAIPEESLLAEDGEGIGAHAALSLLLIELHSDQDAFLIGRGRHAGHKVNADYLSNQLAGNAHFVAFLEPISPRQPGCDGHPFLEGRYVAGYR